MRGYRNSDGEPMNAKLTAIDRDQVVALSAMGWTPTRISSAFPQVTEATVRNCLAGRTFKSYEQQWELPQAPYTKESVR
jgi:hypothetical protein